MRSIVAVVAIIIIALATLNIGALAYDTASSGPPYARTEDLSEQRFGRTYSDPYRWMENSDDAELYVWLRDQETYTKAQTAGALRDQLTVEFKKIFVSEAGDPLLVGSRRFDERMIRRHRFLREQGDGDSEHGLLTAASERYTIVLTPKDADNNTLTDIQTLQIKENERKVFLEDVLRVSFCQVLWDDDEKSFVYISSRDGRLGGATPVIRRHHLGTAQSADQTLLESKSTTENLELVRDGIDTWLIRTDRPENSLSLFNLTTGHVENVVRTKKGNLGRLWLDKGKFWFVSFLKQDMGEIVTFDTEVRKFATVVSARDVPLDKVKMIGNDLYLTYVRNGAHEFVRFEQLGKGTMRVIPLPAQGSVDKVDGNETSGEISFKLDTYTGGPDTYAYNPKTEVVRLVEKGPRPDEPLDATLITYTAYPGWKAPIWVVKRKDVEFSKETPVYLYGYGGFRLNTLPSYDTTYWPFLKRGGAVAFVILPGGLEYGEAWHRLGMLQNKRNVFDAFANAARALIDKGWTNRKKIAMGGASNGGLLAAATACYYPSLFQATVPQVGVLDMARFSLFTLGPQWNSEYGDRDDAGDFRYLTSISPYHNIHKRKHYPATLVVTSDQDDRVVPAHSYKFAARLQAALPGVRSLLHVARGTGHNFLAAAPEENVRTASIMWSFIMEELGVR